MVRVVVWGNGAERPRLVQTHSILVSQRRWMVNLAVYLFNYFQFR